MGGQPRPVRRQKDHEGGGQPFVEALTQQGPEGPQ
jgi:hypothetical protein